MWIDKALAPARGSMRPAAHSRLREALVAMIGIEPVLSMRDVTELDGKTIENPLARSARALVVAARRR